MKNVILKPENSVDFHIRWAWYNISRMYNLQAANFGGSMSLGYALLNIDENGIPSTKLAPKMGMEPRSLTRIIKSLEESGLIKKKSDKKDKRITKLFLTAKGVEQRNLAKNVVVTFNETVYANIPQEDLNITFKVLSKINELIDNEKIYK